MRVTRPLLAAALALAGALPAAADLILLPGELTVSDAPSKSQHQPAVALVQDGALVVWHDGERGIMGRRFNANGTARGAILRLVPSDPLPTPPFKDRVRYEAQEVAIAARPDGSFLAVWVQAKVKHSHDGFSENRLVVAQRIAARYFDAEGRPTSRTWMISGVEGVASRPRVALSGTRFLLTWHERAGRRPGVHVSTLARKGPTQDVLLSERGLLPSIAVGGRGALVVWVKCCGLQSGYQLFAQRLNAAGDLVGESFLPVTDLPRDPQAVAVAGQPGGDFLIAYERLDEPNLTTQTHGQLLSAAGDLVGGELALSGGYGNAHTAPVVAALPAGGWVAGWMTWVSGFRVGTTILALSPLGNALGNPVDLNEMPVAGQELGLAAATDGRLLVVWEGFDRQGAQGLRARAARAH